MSEEKLIENSILGYLHLYGIVTWKNHSVGIYDPTKGVHRKPGKYHRNGVSDILGCAPDGRFIAIEVKTKKSHPSKNQKDFIQDILDNGGIAFVARSIDDVIDNFDKFGIYEDGRFHNSSKDQNSGNKLQSGGPGRQAKTIA